MSGLWVVRPGTSTTVQDLGRPGYRALGVPLGGAADVGAFRLANALVGNTSDCAALEMTLVGGVYEASSNLALALAGAPMEAYLELARGRHARLRVPSAFTLEAGWRLVLGGTRFGARVYLAVHGGFNTPQVLGSRSAERSILAGQLLEARAGRTRGRWIEVGCHADEAAQTAELAIFDGPDALDFDWEGSAFEVDAHSDRVGIRLRREWAGDPVSLDPERLSAPVIPGAIQWTGSQWIILGVAGGTMGGYPHLGQVAQADLDKLGQLRPGDRVRLRRATVEAAREALHARWRELDERDIVLRTLARDGLYAD